MKLMQKSHSKQCYPKKYSKEAATQKCLSLTAVQTIFLYAFYANSCQAGAEETAREARRKFLNCYVMREFLEILFMLRR